MKIAGAKKVHYESGPNMTPLVDVVMVILIFLMLAGSFVGAEHFLASSLPPTESGTAPAEGVSEGIVPDEPLDIRVDSPTPDRFVATAGKVRTDNLDALTQQLTRMRTQLNAAGKATDDIQVKISPGKNVKYKFVISVYEAALRAQFTKVAFGTSH